MLDHLRILSFILVLFVGIGLIVYLFQIYRRHPYTYLIYQAKYSICTSIGYLLLFFYLYANTNLTEGLMTLPIDSVRNLIELFYILIGIGLIYYMLSALMSFRNLSLSKRWKLAIWILILFLIIVFLSKFLLREENILFNAFNLFLNNLYYLILIVEVIMLIASLFFWKKNDKRANKQISRSFSLFYLSRYVIIFLGILILSKYEMSGLVTYAIIFSSPVVANIMPFIWARFFFLRYAEEMQKQLSKTIDVDSICKEFKISNREREVIQLILKGKNNHEIEEALFISYHTVKNHISNIFRKLNVRTKHDLIYLFMKQLKDSPLRQIGQAVDVDHPRSIDSDQFK